MEKIIATEKMRIDSFLAQNLDETRNKIAKLIKEEKILVNGKVIKSNYVLKENDIIEYDLKLNEVCDIEPENIPLDIIYEDEDVIVVNKPSGLVVHPGAGNYSHTLVNALMYHTTNLSTGGGDERPGIVHRIDSGTSGLLVVAKNDKAHAFLAMQLKDKTVSRTYLALVEGIIKEDTACIDAPIGRDKKDRKKMTVTGENSKEAITHLKVLNRYKNTSLIECKLETGRTHQIRVHLKYINHPIINDPVYGNVIIDKEFEQMLHAEKLEFIHPRTKEVMIFTASPPTRFSEILSKYEEEIK